MYSFIYYIQSIMPHSRPALTPAPALTLPIPNAHFIWYCAWLAVPSAVYAFTSTRVPSLGIIPASVWATSLLYWRNPIRDSWPRKLDMVGVFIGASYNTYYAFRNIRHTSPAHFGVYAALIGAAISSYGVSNYLMTRGQVWPATYAHASIHLLGNMANFVLYDGCKYTHT